MKTRWVIALVACLAVVCNCGAYVGSFGNQQQIPQLQSSEPPSPPESDSSCPLLETQNQLETARDRAQSVTILVSPFSGTGDRGLEAQSAVVARMRELEVSLTFDAYLRRAEPEMQPRLRILRLRGMIEDHSAANACARRYDAALVIWGSVYESPLAGPQTISVNPAIAIAASPHVTVGNINAQDRATVNAGALAAHTVINVNVPSPKPFAVLLNATSERRPGTKASSRWDVGSLADVVTDATLSRSALAALPFVAAFFYLDRGNFLAAAALFAQAEEAAPGDNLASSARLLRAVAMVFGGRISAGLALVDKLKLEKKLGPVATWQLKMLESVAVMLKGDPRAALRSSVQAEGIAKRSPDLENVRGLAELNTAGILLRMGKPYESLEALGRAQPALRDVCNRPSSDDFECAQARAQALIIAAFAASWLGQMDVAEGCFNRAISATGDLEAAVTAQDKRVATAFLAFAVDSPSFLDSCGLVHLLAVDGASLPRLGALPPKLSQILPLIEQAELPGEVKARVNCGLALAVRAGWLPASSPDLYKGQVEPPTGDPARLLSAELALARASVLLARGEQAQALSIIEAQLPALDFALGKDSAPAVEWRNTVQALETGKRPKAGWRRPPSSLSSGFQTPSCDSW